MPQSGNLRLSAGVGAVEALAQGQNEWLM